MKIRRFIKRFVSFIKRDPKEYVALICAACIMAISFLTASYPAFAAATSWDDVSADAIALKNAYIDYFKSLSSGDFGDVLGSAVDIPISWLKTMSDGALAISPVDDLYYYLKDGVLQYEDNRSHRAGGGGGRRRGEATEIKPDIPASFVKQVNDYWSEHYKPHANSQQYIVSYQTQGMTDTSFDRLKKGAILYGDGNSWGNKQWDTVYVLPFVQDDFGGTYYCNSYFHFYSTRDDDVKFNRDLVQIDSGKVAYSDSCLWADNTYFSIQWIKNNNGQIWVTGWKDFSSFNSTTSVYGTLPDLGNCRFLNSDFKEVYASDVYNSSSFTPWNNKNDDIGFILSSEPFELVSNQIKINYDKIPDNYTITITGDTIYDYDITNPDTGDHSTVNNYITNNYTIPGGKKDDDDPSSGGGSGTTGGNVTVGGKVDVSGKIEIDTKPIDININVNTSGSSSQPDSSTPSGSGGTGEDPGDYIDPGTIDTDINGYLDKVPEVSKNFIDYLKDFFAWLPPEIYGLIILGLVVAIFCRISGR